MFNIFYLLVAVSLFAPILGNNKQNAAFKSSIFHGIDVKKHSFLWNLIKPDSLCFGYHAFITGTKQQSLSAKAKNGDLYVYQKYTGGTSDELCRKDVFDKNNNVIQSENYDRRDIMPVVCRKLAELMEKTPKFNHKFSEEVKYFGEEKGSYYAYANNQEMFSIHKSPFKPQAPVEMEVTDENRKASAGIVRDYLKAYKIPGFTIKIAPKAQTQTWYESLFGRNSRA
jgi:hypothetical protein